MNTKWQTSFVVYPENCNYMTFEEKPMVHGGTMLMNMDRAAAECVRRFLYDSPCNNARTVGVNNLAFSAGAKLGDLIIIQCEIVHTGIKHIDVHVSCMVESREGSQEMAFGTFSFCSFLNDKSHPHGMKL